MKSCGCKEYKILSTYIVQNYRYIVSFSLEVSNS